MAERPKPSTALRNLPDATLLSSGYSHFEVQTGNNGSAIKWAERQGIQPVMHRLVVAGYDGVSAAVAGADRLQRGNKRFIKDTPLFAGGSTTDPNTDFLEMFDDIRDSRGPQLRSVFEHGVTLLGVAQQASELVAATVPEVTRTDDGVLYTHKGVNPPFIDDGKTDQWGDVGSNFGSGKKVGALSVTYAEGEDETVWFGADFRTEGVPRQLTAIVTFPEGDIVQASAVNVDVVNTQGVSTVWEHCGFDVLKQFSSAMSTTNPHINKAR